MKIVHLLDERWDSGLTAYALQIARLQADHGHEVTVGVRPGKKPEAAAHRLKLHTAPAYAIPDIWRLLSSQYWDIINAHTGRTQTWAVLMRGIAGSPRTAVFRTRGDARRVSSGPLSRALYRWTDGVISASAHIGEQYASEFQLSEERVRVIYPSIAADPAASPSEPATVGILGRLDPVKGHSVFLEAAAHVLRKRPDARFLVAGAEANVSIDLLLNQSRALGLEKNVQFLGFQPDARAFMRRCAIGVIASVGSEEISRACQEWMAVGRPVVGTLVGCLPELIEPDETGALVPPGDGGALGEAIVRFLSDPDTAHRTGENARHLIERRFSPERQLEETQTFYRWAIARRATPA